jgi:hypothetical protein
MSKMKNNFVILVIVFFTNSHYSFAIKQDSTKINCISIGFNSWPLTIRKFEARIENMYYFFRREQHLFNINYYFNCKSKFLFKTSISENYNVSGSEFGKTLKIGSLLPEIGVQKGNEKILEQALKQVL